MEYKLLTKIGVKVMIMKKYLLIILIFLGIFFSGCLSSEAINSDDIRISDFEWRGIYVMVGSEGMSYNMNVDYRGEMKDDVVVYTYISKSSTPPDYEGKDLSTLYGSIVDRFVLNIEVTKFYGIYRDYTVDDDEGHLYLYMYSEDGKLIKTKQIDKPRFDFEIIDRSYDTVYNSNIVPLTGIENLGKCSTPYYIIVKNTGNINRSTSFWVG